MSCAERASAGGTQQPLLKNTSSHQTGKEHSAAFFFYLIEKMDRDPPKKQVPGSWAVGSQQPEQAALLSNVPISRNDYVLEKYLAIYSQKL